MPVLARTLEAAGLSTVVVTNMPYWAEKVGAPRVLAVEHPFGHPLGEPGDAAGQMKIIRQALDVLARAETPGEIVHSDAIWPRDTKQAIEDWQPLEPSPLIAVMGPSIRQMLKARRKA